MGDGVGFRGVLSVLGERCGALWCSVLCARAACSAQHGMWHAGVVNRCAWAGSWAVGSDMASESSCWAHGWIISSGQCTQDTQHRLAAVHRQRGQRVAIAGLAERSIFFFGVYDLAWECPFGISHLITVDSLMVWSSAGCAHKSHLGGTGAIQKFEV